MKDLLWKIYLVAADFGGWLALCFIGLLVILGFVGCVVAYVLTKKSRLFRNLAIALTVVFVVANGLVFQSFKTADAKANAALAVFIEKTITEGYVDQYQIERESTWQSKDFTESYTINHSDELFGIWEFSVVFTNNLSYHFDLRYDNGIWHVLTRRI
jgi:hypothetical protein